MIKRSIVMGACNEADIIEASLKELSGWLKAHNLLSSTELIVVAVDSEDGTADIVDSCLHMFKQAKLIRPGPRVGKGRDIKLGMNEASGQSIVFMDADLATPLDNLNEMFAELDRGADFVIGVRDIKTMHNSLARRLSSQVSNLGIRMLLLQNVKDTQCGFKGFSARAAAQVFNLTRIKGWAFDIEVIALMKMLGYQRKELQIANWHDPKPEGQGLVGDSQVMAMIKTLIEAVKIRWNIIRGSYDT